MATAKKDTEKKTSKKATEKTEAVKKRQAKDPGQEAEPITASVDVEQQMPDKRDEVTEKPTPAVKEENPANAESEQPAPDAQEAPATKPKTPAKQEEIEKKAEEETDKLFQSNGIMLGTANKKEEGEVTTVEDLINKKEAPTETAKKPSRGRKISRTMQYTWNGQVMD